MSKYLKLTIGIIAIFLASCFGTSKKSYGNTTQPVDYVNPYMGNISYIIMPDNPGKHKNTFVSYYTNGSVTI